MAIFSNSRYQEVVVHDLRTPLNVISLALRMLDESPVAKDTESAEDLGMIRANALELERMLVHLVDFSRLPERRDGLALDRFDPRRLLEEVAAELRPARGVGPVELDLASGPAEVTLDPLRARMAYQKALLNAAAASMGAPIRIRLDGAPGRCVATFRLDVPPRDSVRSHEIDALHFERLLGTTAERRGLDLAITARVSTLFGGSARLEATPGQGTAVILDWPARLASSS